MWRRTRTDQANALVKLGGTIGQARVNHASFKRRKMRIEAKWRGSEIEMLLNAQKASWSF